MGRARLRQRRLSQRVRAHVIVDPVHADEEATVKQQDTPDPVEPDTAQASPSAPAPPSGPLFYFGCQHGAGHFLFRSDGSSANVYTATPWGRTIDGALSYGPQRRFFKNREVEAAYQQEGAAKLTHEHGWTAVDFWDRSVDQRYGSHSVFARAGTYSFEDMMGWAKAAFPWVFTRLSFEVFLGQETEVQP